MEQVLKVLLDIKALLAHRVAAERKEIQASRDQLGIVDIREQRDIKV